MIPTKNLLLFVATLSLLTTLTLADSPVNYCGTGMCLKCKLEPESGVKVCTKCYNNHLNWVQIGGKSVKGGKCEGKITFKNCLIVGGDGSAPSCLRCLPGFYKQKSVKDCEAIGVPKCMFSDGDSTQCLGCEIETFPNAKRDTCSPTDAAIPGCLLFGRSSEGTPNCFSCKWNYYLSSEDRMTCTLRVTDDTHAPCSKYYNGGGFNVAGGCNEGCNFRAGYFAGDVVPRQARALGGDAGGDFLRLNPNPGHLVCAKNPDAPFDPANPYPPSSGGDAKLLSWFVGFLSLVMAAIHLNCL